MRKLALAAAFLTTGLAASAVPALAQQNSENWVVVGMKGGAMGWETSTIEVDAEAGVTIVSRLIYFAAGRKLDDQVYNFEAQDLGFKCKERQFQVFSLMFMESDGFIFDGGLPENPVWQPVRDATPEGVLWAAVCEKADVVGKRAYGDMKAALEGAKTQALPE